MVGKNASYTMILLLATMAWGCTHYDQPPGNGKELILKLHLSVNSDNPSTGTVETTNNTIENRLVAERITICLYNTDTGAPLLILFDGSENAKDQNSENNATSEFSFLIPQEIISNNKNLGIAVYQRPYYLNNTDFIHENLNTNITGLTFSYPNEVELSSMWIDNDTQTNCFPASGYKRIDLNKISNGEALQIDLIRALAKVEISAVDGILIESASIVKSPEMARLLPSLSENFDEYSATPNVEDTPLSECKFQFIQNVEGNYIAYISEISAEQLNADRGIFSVRVNNKDYILMFTNYIDGKPQSDPDPSSGYDCILRNSMYRFEILGVENEGSNGKLIVNAEVSPWIKHKFIIPI